MDLFLSIIAFLVIFSLVVLIHEAGHFLMARRAGIKVHEFGIGLPPRVYGIKRNEVLWSINLIPFGGFVRMLGEDMSDKEAMKSKNSFVNKSLGLRIKVVVGGVAMNIILAFVLLTIGFIVGMEPLIVTGEDFLAQIRAGNVRFEHGIVAKSIVEGSLAHKKGILPNDRIVKVAALPAQKSEGQKDVEEVVSRNLPYQGILQLVIDRNGEKFMSELVLDQERPGIQSYPVVEVPQVRVFEVREGSISQQIGLLAGDIISKIDKREVFSVSEFKQRVSDVSKEIELEIRRGDQILNLIYPLSIKNGIIISKVFSGSPAQIGGLNPQDLIVKINDIFVFTPQEVQNLTLENKGKAIVYTVSRSGVLQDFSVTVPNEGVIGVSLTNLISSHISDLILYNGSLLNSVTSIKDIQYPFYIAPFKVFSEMKRLSYLTANMFGSVLKKILGEGKVPEGVAGPIGIARMTYTFVQQGFTSLLRFTALISLSLGVINILPLPALDGGRLAFLIAEGIAGRRLNQMWEARIHAIGFFLLILLILFVTYNDIVAIFE